MAHQLAAAAVASPFPDGVWFVSLAEVSCQEDVAALEEYLAGVIMQAVGFQPATHPSVRQQLTDYLQDKRLLLVLDNWEHLLAGLGLVHELLGRLAHVSVLATSRQALQLRGEQVIALDGLPVPAVLEPAPASAPLATGAALQLFADSARRSDHRFSLSPEVLPDAWRIVRFVQGNPLGIELAAAWVDRLAPATIAAALEQNGLELLATPLRNVPERQRRMRAVLDYPWQLLSPAERTVLALEYVGYVQTYLEQEELAGYFDPVWIFFTCYEVLQATGQPSAGAILAQAVGWLEQQAAYLPAEAQRAFLEDVPEHAATIKAWQAIQEHGQP